MFFALAATFALAAEPWTAADPKVDVAATLAACRADATLVGPRGKTVDPRLVDACAEAHGLRHADRAEAWLPSAGCVDPAVAVVAAADAWAGCLHDAFFVDASGWPRIQAGEAEACMADAGWIRAADAVRLARAETCALSPVAAR